MAPLLLCLGAVSRIARRKGVWPWGTTDRQSGAVAGEVIWQGEWHSPYDVPQNWFFTWGGVRVTWTAPNPDVTSTIHNACSHDVYWNGSQVRTRAAPSGCIPHGEAVAAPPRQPKPAKGLVGDQAPVVEVGRLELPYGLRLG
jgi:hypothetical protein